jgi:hypothetical protein
MASHQDPAVCLHGQDIHVIIRARVETVISRDFRPGGRRQEQRDQERCQYCSHEFGRMIPAANSVFIWFFLSRNSNLRIHISLPI